MMQPDYLQLIGFGPHGWGKQLATGTVITFAVAVCGFVLAIVLGSLVAWGKVAGGRLLQLFSTFYITALRGVPDLLVIYLVYFGSSALLSKIGRFFSAEGFLSLPGFIAGMIAIGVVGGAQSAEVLRGAWTALPKGESEAACAFGFSRLRCFRRIVAPLVLRYAMPGLSNIWLSLLKDSSLLSATGLIELMRVAQTGADSTRMPFNFYLTAAAIYILIAIISGIGLRRAERYYQRGCGQI